MENAELALFQQFAEMRKAREKRAENRREMQDAAINALVNVAKAALKELNVPMSTVGYEIQFPSPGKGMYESGISMRSFADAGCTLTSHTTGDWSDTFTFQVTIRIADDAAETFEITSGSTRVERGYPQRDTEHVAFSPPVSNPQDLTKELVQQAFMEQLRGFLEKVLVLPATPAKR